MPTQLLNFAISIALFLGLGLLRQAQAAKIHS